MNTKCVKLKTFIFALLFLLTCTVLSAWEYGGPGGSYITLGAGIRAAAGQGREFVLNNREPLSILNWQVLPSLGFQLNLDAYLMQRIHFSLTIHAGLPIICGKMTDEDYLNSVPSEKTHFSAHDAFLKKDFSFLYTIGILCPPYVLNAGKNGKTVLKFEPLTGIRVSVKNWYAVNGYYQYPPEKHKPFSVWSENSPKKPYTGNGVEYTQKIYLPFIGLNIFAETEKNIDFSFGFHLSPHVTGQCTDLHLDDSKKLKYEDVFESGGWSFTLNHSLIKRFTSKFGLMFHTSFLFFANYDGYTNVSNINGQLMERTEQGASGTSLTEFSAALGVIFYLGKK